MKKRLLFLPIAALVIGVTMLFAATANAQGPGTNTKSWTFTTTPIFAGVEHDTGDFNNLNAITVIGDAQGSHVGFATNQTTGTFTFGNTTVTGDVHTPGMNGDELVGFLYINNPASGPSNFTAGINGGTINVTATTGSAFGAMFRDVGASERWSDITGGTQNFGAMTVKTLDPSGAGATGYTANSLRGGTVNIAGIEVEGKHYAAGVAFTGNIESGMLNVTGPIMVTNDGIEMAQGIVVEQNITGGTVNTGAITAIGIGATEAIGFHVGGNVALGAADSITLGNITAKSATAAATGFHVQGASTGAGTITLGAVTAESGTSAAGILVDGGDAKLTLTNNVTAIATEDTGIAAGVAVLGNLDLTLGADVTVLGKQNDGKGISLLVGNDANINLNGRNLTTHNTVHVYGDMGVTGNGRAQFFGEVSTPSTTLSNGATLAVDGTKASLGAITFDISGDLNRLEIFGNTTEIGKQVGTVVFDNPNDPVEQFLAGMQIFNSSELTAWGLDYDTGIIQSFGARARANVNDNYLAASRMHHKYTAWNAVRDHLISGAGTVNRNSGYYGQVPCERVVCVSSCCKQARNVWANYVGRNSRYQSSFNGNEWKMSGNGIQFGTDFIRTPRAQLGAFFGYEDLTGTNAADRINGDDYYFGLYAVHVFRNGSDLRTVFSYGWQDFASQRLGADGNHYNMAFKGNTAELNIEFGQRHYFSRWSTRPSVALDWYLSHLHSGRETPAGNSALRYDSTDLSQLHFRFGTDLRYSCGRLTLDSGLYYSYDMLGKTPRTGVADSGGMLRSTLVGSELGRSTISYNFGASWMVNNKFSLLGGYRGEYVPESAGKGYVNIGHVGAAFRW